MNEVDDFRGKTLARQAEAEAAFHQGDPGPRMEMWSRQGPVTLFGAAGMYRFGWDQLSRIFPWVASRFSNVSDYRFDVLVARRHRRHGLQRGLRALHGSIDGRPVELITVRAIHVYRREGGKWKIVHRGGDNPPPDQSPPMPAR
jgi:ketosteroid isomerase-like protein